ncbi:MAG TPA: hypothetical protein VLC91_08460 [Spongiibacteraceae bacterium]|nr:hypothetical protein [Spongiibacteraceae bacterium]
MNIWLAAAALILGFFVGFLTYFMGGYQYHLAVGNLHKVPLLYVNPLTRVVYFIMAAVLTLVAGLISPYWWITSIIVVWVIVGWQNGKQLEYNDEVGRFAKRFMEDEGLDVEAARKKARQVLSVK